MRVNLRYKSTDIIGQNFSFRQLLTIEEFLKWSVKNFGVKNCFSLHNSYVREDSDLHTNSFRLWRRSAKI